MVYGYVWGVWCCIGMYNDVEGRMVMYSSVWECIGMHGDV